MGILCDTSAKEKLDNAGVKIEIKSVGEERKLEFVDGRQVGPLTPKTQATLALRGNAKRQQASFRNDPGTGAGDACYLLLSTNDGPQVSSTFHTVKLNVNDFYELPQGKDGKVFMGDIWYIYASVVATNVLQVNEGFFQALDESSI